MSAASPPSPPSPIGTAPPIGSSAPASPMSRVASMIIGSLPASPIMMGSAPASPPLLASPSLERQESVLIDRSPSVDVDFDMVALPPKEIHVPPKNTAAGQSMLSIYTYSYMMPLLKLGTQRPLKQEDICALSPLEQSTIRLQELENAAKRVAFEGAEKERRNGNVPFNASITSTVPVSTSSYPSTPTPSALPSPPSPALGPTLGDPAMVPPPPSAFLDPEPSFNVWKALWYQFGGWWMETQLFLLLYSGLKITQPLMLYQLVSFLTDTSESTWHGYAYALILGFSAILLAPTHHQYFGRMGRIGMDVRVALTSLIYKTSLSLKTSDLASSKITTSHVINLMGTDVGKVEELCGLLPYFWNLPMELGIVLAILYQRIGSAAFAGFAVIVCILPLQLYFSHLFTSYRARISHLSDARTRLIKEILTNEIIIKMMNKESSFQAKVDALRQEEVTMIKKSIELKSINKASFFATLALVNLCTFLTMYYQNRQFTSANVFSTISLFAVVRFPLTTYLPNAIEKLSETRIAFRRIALYLSLNEDQKVRDEKKYAVMLNEVKIKNQELVDEMKHGSRKQGQQMMTREPGSLYMRQASFVWQLNDELDAVNSSSAITSSSAGGDFHMIDMSFTSIACPPASPSFATMYPHNNGSSSSTHHVRQGLQLLDIHIQPGSLVGVIGSVGSYKSSFLAACLGEMTQIHGGMCINGVTTYSPQAAWIFAGTIRENILFGREFEKERYMKVLRACQLLDDIKILPYGDQTLIGESGVNMNGGMRTRLTCARAVYTEADIYLLDDPLSALDSIVANKLFDAVLGPQGMLADKTRILVTHQTHVLHHADHIILLAQGRIVSQGTFDELVKEGHLTEEMRYAPPPTTVSNGSNGSGSDPKKSSMIANSPEARRRALNHQLRRGRQRGVNIVREQHPTNAVQSSELEDGTQGGLDGATLMKLLRAGGGMLLASLLCFLIIAAQGVSVYTDKYLSLWSAMSAEKQRDDTRAYILIGLVAGTVFLGVIRARACFRYVLESASQLHAQMFHSILYSSMVFFESNPIGRILNRFSADQNKLDEILPLSLFDMIQCLGMCLGSLVVIGMTTPYVLIALAPSIPIFIWIRQRYIPTARELKRIDGLTRSSMYEHVSSTLSGLMIIRSFKKDHMFLQTFIHRLDANSQGIIINILAGRWFGLRLDLLAGAVVMCLGIYVAASRGTLTPSNAGLALSYTLTLSSLFQWLTRQTADVEANMTSVERVCEYAELPQEAEFIKTNPMYRIQKGWPSTGRIEFKDYSMRYRQGADLILKNINLTIEPGEKVGIIGRTGSGKSSLFQAILRLCEADSGKIQIDGRQIDMLGLSDLRSNLSIILQYPVIFSGSIRYNLDPLDEYTDDQIWSALECVQLKGMIQKMKDNFHTELSEYGSNLSVGECQLLCVARAILKPSAILLVDEATANVDSKTDQLIQSVIREKFKDRTVLTIAHRLNTILDCQKIIVMSNGSVSEVGTPAQLLVRQETSLVADLNSTKELLSLMSNQHQQKKV